MGLASPCGPGDGSKEKPPPLPALFLTTFSIAKILAPFQALARSESPAQAGMAFRHGIPPASRPGEKLPRIKTQSLFLEKKYFTEISQSFPALDRCARTPAGGWSPLIFERVRSPIPDA
jgi:hypothetical protein